jgi:hypothetical protein
MRILGFTVLAGLLLCPTAVEAQIVPGDTLAQREQLTMAVRLSRVQPDLSLIRTRLLAQQHR